MGFVRRSGPYVPDHSTNDDATIDPQGLASHRRKSPVSGINPQSHGDPADLNDTVSDALAEFERWVASGAVEILPD